MKRSAQYQLHFTQVRTAFFLLIALSGMLVFLNLDLSVRSQSNEGSSKRQEKLRELMLADREGVVTESVFPPPPVMRPAEGTILYAYDYGENRIVSFDASAPETYLSSVLIQNAAVTVVKGIDIRPRDGRLYGLVDDFPHRARVYVIDPTTGNASMVHQSNSFSSTITPFSAFDFDPSRDLASQISEQMTNRTIHPTFGTQFSSGASLRYADSDPNFGLNPSIVHTAYHYSSATGVSTLYGIDVQANTLVRIGDAAGQLESGMLYTVGPLGIDPTRFGGMDIAPDGTVAYAVLNVSSIPTLFSVDLQTGAASQIGAVGTGNMIDGLAIVISPYTTIDPTPSPTPAPEVVPLSNPPQTEIITSVGSLKKSDSFPSERYNSIEFVTAGNARVINFTVSYDTNMFSRASWSRGTSMPPDAGIEIRENPLQGTFTVRIECPRPMPPGTYEIGQVALTTQLSRRIKDESIISFVAGTSGNQITDANNVILPTSFRSFKFNVDRPTAGTVVSGRVDPVDGQRFGNAEVSLISSGGVRLTTKTDVFGRFRFETVEIGRTYVLKATSGTFQFPNRLVTAVPELGTVIVR